MGLLKQAMQQVMAKEGVEAEFLNTPAKVIQSARQAKYADLRKREKGYIQGVHKARKESKK